MVNLTRSSVEIDVKNQWNLRFENNETSIFVRDGDVVFKLKGQPKEVLKVVEVETSYGAIHLCLEAKVDSPVSFRKRLRFASIHDEDEFLTKFDFERISLSQVEGS